MHDSSDYPHELQWTAATKCRRTTVDCSFIIHVGFSATSKKSRRPNNVRSAVQVVSHECLFAKLMKSTSVDDAYRKLHIRVVPNELLSPKYLVEYLIEYPIK